MKVLRNFVVEVPDKFKDTIEIGGKEIFIDTRFDEFGHRVSHGVVVSAPYCFDTGVREGDTLFFHHHVTQNVNLALGDNRYLVVYDRENTRGCQAIAYRNKKKELHMLAEWVFVQPLEREAERVTESGIVLDLKADKKEEKEARVFMPHPKLEVQGVGVGSIVGFDRSSDYKIKLDDGSIVFRMTVDDLCYVKES